MLSATLEAFLRYQRMQAAPSPQLREARRWCRQGSLGTQKLNLGSRHTPEGVDLRENTALHLRVTGDGEDGVCQRH